MFIIHSIGIVYPSIEARNDTFMNSPVSSASSGMEKSALRALSPVFYIQP